MEFPECEHDFWGRDFAKKIFVTFLIIKSAYKLDSKKLPGRGAFLNIKIRL